jgi:peroxiredoxin
MPTFSLPSATGDVYHSSDCMGVNGMVVVFTCNHCPYALAIWDRLIHLSLYAQSLGISVVAVNPNINPKYPQDSPEKMQALILDRSLPFPYLVDTLQKTARSYKAQCTPDIFLLRSNYRLFYHGRLDDNWQSPEKVTVHDLKNAIQHLSQQLAHPSPQYPSMGCSIKWND